MSYYSDEIKRLKECEAQEKRVEEANKFGHMVREIYQAFVEAGFTEEQAYEILTIYLKK